MLLFIQTNTKAIIAEKVQETETELIVDWPMELVITPTPQNKPLMHFMPLTILCNSSTISLNKNVLLFYTEVDPSISSEYENVIRQIKAQKMNIILPNSSNIINENNTASLNNVLNLRK